MLRAYKYRLYPTAEQRRRIDHSISVCRLVYNMGLQLKIWAWQYPGRACGVAAVTPGKETGRFKLSHYQNIVYDT